MYFTDDRYTDDCHYRGGLLRKYYDVGHYGTCMIACNALPPYPEWSGGDWATVWEEHLAHNEPYLLKWLEHQTDGPYWRHGSVAGHRRPDHVPGLHDRRLARRLSEPAAAPATRRSTCRRRC